MKRLEITIKGPSCTGKSTFAEIIRKICQENNISVKIDDEDNEIVAKNLDRCLCTLSGKIGVIVKTKRDDYPDYGEALMMGFFD